MSFDEAAFLKQKFTDRTSVLSLPVLKPWGITEVTVRGLTAAEIAKAEEAKLVGDKVAAIANALGKTKVDVTALKDAIGTGDKTPDDTIKRKELILAGMVEPKLSEAAIVKLGETFPIEFVQLSNEIAKLSGKGRSLEKPRPSGIQALK